MRIMTPLRDWSLITPLDVRTKASSTVMMDNPKYLGDARQWRGGEMGGERGGERGERREGRGERGEGAKKRARERDGREMRIHYEGNEKQKSHRVGNIVYPTSISFVRITGKQGDKREDKGKRGWRHTFRHQTGRFCHGR